MGNRVSYPIHIKEMAIQMKKENIPVKIIMAESVSYTHLTLPTN
ncbi:hypothetical protein [Enterococcus faecalis]|nr:hypothetical protein [Enterococcus faecalis]